MTRLVFVAAVFFLPVRTQAALHAEVEQPYKLRVALRVAPHRLLTPIFKEQLRRELRDSLQAALGALGRVEILDMTLPSTRAESPLLQAVESKGLQQGLDSWHEVSDIKTHFLFVDFVNGRYQIQARQFDGLTGLASPVLRHESLSERLLVGRAAALLIYQDFGMVGTLGKVDGDMVEVELKGGGLGVSLDPWVKPRDVFAITQISQRGASQQALRVPWALLQVVSAPNGAVCRCQLFHRYDPALPGGPAVLGFRCLKLRTTAAPLHLRLVRNDRFGTPISGQQVLVSTQGFSDTPKEQPVSQTDGLVQTQQRYRNIAFVRVVEGATVLAKVPVEIVDERVVVCPVGVNMAAEQRGQLELRKERWVRRVSESLDVVTVLVKELNTLAKQSSKDALQRAQRGIAELKADIRSLEEEQANLHAAAGGVASAVKLDLAEGEQRLKDLSGRREELERYVKGLEDAIKEENDPRRQEWKAKVAQAKLLEGEFEFAKAIELYDEVLAEAGKEEKLSKYVADLKESWKTRSKQHEEARTFIYETWPKLADSAQIQAHLDKARAAFATCRDAGDQLSPLMLQKANVAHATKLKKELDALRPQEEDDRKSAEVIEKVANDLKELIQQVSDYLKSK